MRLGTYCSLRAATTLPFDHPAGFETAAQFPGAIIEAYRGKALCISADAFIAPGAAVIGDVTFGSILLIKSSLIVV